MTIQERLDALRNAMQQQGLSAIIVPGTDPHASEYIADHWKERIWMSGFDGSAGTAALTLSEAGLWTDSRYFIQGEQQLRGTGIQLMKMGLPDTPDTIKWICQKLNPGEKLGVNPQMFSVNTYAAMRNELANQGIQLIDVDLINMCWTDRPALPTSKFFVFPLDFCGKKASEKLNDLRTEMINLQVDVTLLSALDDIAWLYNIRGNDVDYNPVVIAYSIVTKEKAIVFIDDVKLTNETRAYLASEGIELAPYETIYEALNQLEVSKTVLVDGAKLNQKLYASLPVGCKRKNVMSPVFKLKSIKNPTEVAGIRTAMKRDGVALTRFFMWFEAELPTGKLSEVSIADKLYEFRTKQDNFIGESFATIAGYAGHGAIVHYRANAETDAMLEAKNLLLLDSGGQYLNGTTDITRTLTLGEPTRQQKSDFTLVLKGHIALARAIFPTGTRGSQLDVLARKALWDMGLNYGHGTGHGVGHFLNVHEGPQSIRMDENPAVLQAGMIMSNEPGMYRSNEYGIRIENLIHVVPAVNTEFGQFLEFETLTLFPIDRNLIETMLLTEEEIEWIDDYHRRVFETLAPELEPIEQEWLNSKCLALEF